MRARQGGPGAAAGGSAAAQPGARAAASLRAREAGRAVGSGARAQEAGTVLVGTITMRGQTMRLVLRPGPRVRKRRLSTPRAVAVHQRYNLMGLCRMGCGRPLHLYRHRCDKCQAIERKRARTAYRLKVF